MNPSISRSERLVPLPASLGSLVVSLLLAAAPGLAQQPVVEVWAVPSVQKVRPDAAPEEKNLVWSQTTRTVAVAGARNEHVPFQLVISTPPPKSRYEKAAAGFFVEASDLSSGQGRIDKEQIKLYFEHVVLCYAKSSPVGDTGFWPDALAPLTDPFNMSAEFRSFVKSRAVWVDILVPEAAPAGTYQGEIEATQNGAQIGELNVSLKVYDFTLPQETHLITYMGISAGRLADFHGSSASPESRSAVLQKYYEFLYSHRMEPWFNQPLQPAVELSGGREVHVRFDDGLYRRYMTELKTKRVILEAAPAELRRGTSDPPFSENFNARVKSYLSQLHRYFERNGWLQKLVLNSPIDEPNTAQQYIDTRKWAELVHEAAPGVPFLVTESPVPDRPEWGTLSGYANHFSVHGNRLNRLDVKQAIREEQSKGGEITWYISCDQVYPQPNYFIDAFAMDPVMIPWITWRYGMNGILYWSTTFWPQTPDPWQDPVTFLSGFLCSNGYVLNGEGSLIYPGSRTRRYTGQRDIDGPVSSIRLELLREGIEDYEYLWLLKSLGDEEFANEAVKSMVVDVSTFSRNVAELFSLRTRMAERIETLSKRKR
jgi:hypothetical protein